MHVISRLMVTLTIIGTILVSRVSLAHAQDDPPDLKMLLNLDLFGRSQAQSGPATGAAAPSRPSMLEQIRTLRAMGYLGGEGGQKAAASSSGSPRQGSLPSGNVEVTPSQSDDQGASQL